MIHPLVKKSGILSRILWWRKDKPLEKNEFNELKTKILRKAELEGKLKHEKEQ